MSALENIPTPAMIEELKDRLKEKSKNEPQIAWDYAIAREYLDYVERMLRPDLYKRTPEGPV